MEFCQNLFVRLFRLPILIVTINAALAFNTYGEAALPNLEVVNAVWSNITNLWRGSAPLQFPTKLTVEFSQKENGMVSALICEYPKRDDALFEAIRERLQRELNIEPRMVLDGPYVLWRDEVGRRTVALTVDESKEHIQLIVVSILR